MKIHRLTTALAFLGLAAAAFAQQETAIAIEGQKVVLKYGAPTVKTRAAASFHSEADLIFKGMSLPKGDYTVYILADGPQWQLALNKATGAKAATYDPKLDVGKVAMTMGKAPAPATACKIVLTKTAALAGKVEVSWNDAVASTPFHLDRGASDSEW
jgi:hypothetical protein